MRVFLLAASLLAIIIVSGCVQPPAAQPAVPTEPAPAPAEVRLEANCTAFPDRLAACAPYRCLFRHPLIGGMMERTITGVVNGTCLYDEQMPNNGKFECKYTESMRKAVAQYYRDLAAAQSTGTNATLDTRTGKSEANYTIDGKQVSNPLQEALDNGMCGISGYGFLQSGQ